MEDFINLFGAIVAVIAGMDDYKFFSLLIAAVLIAAIWKGADWVAVLKGILSKNKDTE